MESICSGEGLNKLGTSSQTFIAKGHLRRRCTSVSVAPQRLQTGSTVKPRLSRAAPTGKALLLAFDRYPMWSFYMIYVNVHTHIYE